MVAATGLFFGKNGPGFMLLAMPRGLPRYFYRQRVTPLLGPVIEETYRLERLAIPEEQPDWYEFSDKPVLDAHFFTHAERKGCYCAGFFCAGHRYYTVPVYVYDGERVRD